MKQRHCPVQAETTRNETSAEVAEPSAIPSATRDTR